MKKGINSFNISHIYLNTFIIIIYLTIGLIVLCIVKKKNITGLMIIGIALCLIVTPIIFTLDNPKQEINEKKKKKKKTVISQD